MSNARLVLPIPSNKCGRKAVFGFPCIISFLVSEPSHSEQPGSVFCFPKIHELLHHEFSLRRGPVRSSGPAGLFRCRRGGKANLSLSRATRSPFGPVDWRRARIPVARSYGHRDSGCGVALRRRGSSRLGPGVTRSDETRTSSAPMRNRKVVPAFSSTRYGPCTRDSSL